MPQREVHNGTSPVSAGLTPTSFVRPMVTSTPTGTVTLCWRQGVSPQTSALPPDCPSPLLSTANRNLGEAVARAVSSIAPTRRRLFADPCDERSFGVAAALQWDRTANSRALGRGLPRKPPTVAALSLVLYHHCHVGTVGVEPTPLSGRGNLQFAHPIEALPLSYVPAQGEGCSRRSRTVYCFCGRIHSFAGPGIKPVLTLLVGQCTTRP